MSSMSEKRYIIVKAGDRLDILANRIYGNPYKYIFLLHANPTLDPWHPRPGQQIEVPNG